MKTTNKTSDHGWRMSAEYSWPEIFTSENFEGKSKAELCAVGLCAWGNCHAGSRPPESFGRVLAKIGQCLGISSTGDELMKWAKENVK